MTVFCGIDWAERHHDIALVDGTGTLLAKARISDDAAGYGKLLDILAEHGDSPSDPISVAIETSHGLLVAALRTGSRKVFAINPLAAARYRDRHSVSRKKSDPGDALVLANILRTDMQYARQLPAVEDAFGHQLLALLKQLDAACQAANDLAAAVDEAFRQHADSEILLSFPGLGPLLGARVLAEIGDDRNRFSDARALKSYAGSAPITRASGKKRYVGRRFVKNNRLMNAGFLWSFSALQASPGANAHYRRRREHGDWPNAAQRHLLNRFLGQLHHCLQSGQHFDELRAFAPFLSVAVPAGCRPDPAPVSMEAASNGEGEP
nr:transposase [Streptomyces marokkonensis]